jgi:hypothetical protein
MLPCRDLSSNNLSGTLPQAWSALSLAYLWVPALLTCLRAMWRRCCSTVVPPAASSALAIMAEQSHRQQQQQQQQQQQRTGILLSARGQQPRHDLPRRCRGLHNNSQLCSGNECFDYLAKLYTPAPGYEPPLTLRVWVPLDACPSLDACRALYMAHKAHTRHSATAAESMLGPDGSLWAAAETRQPGAHSSSQRCMPRPTRAPALWSSQTLADQASCAAHTLDRRPPAHSRSLRPSPQLRRRQPRHPPAVVLRGDAPRRLHPLRHLAASL